MGEMNEIAPSVLFGKALETALMRGIAESRKYKVTWEGWNYDARRIQRKTMSGKLKEVQLAKKFYERSYLMIRSSSRGLQEVDVTEIIRIQEVE